METAKAVIDVVKDRCTGKQDAFVNTVSDELISHIMDAYRIGIEDGTARTLQVMREGMGSVALEATPQ